MTRDSQEPSRPAPIEHARLPPTVSLLERLTGLVLILVLIAVAWMVAVANFPGVARLSSVEAEAVIVLILLSLSLVLVTVVALAQTRR